MLHISVPQEGAHQTNHRWLTFEVPPAPVMFAGSRNGLVDSESARLLVQAFHNAGLSCSTGCATGVDESFRKAFSAAFREDLPDLVACAFESRLAEADRLGLPATYVSDPNMEPWEALRYRTQWLAYNCSLLVLFPDDPETGEWGRGSYLAFRTAKQLEKPIFVMSQSPPKPEEDEKDEYIIQNSDLFGLFQGTWLVFGGIVP